MSRTEEDDEADVEGLADEDEDGGPVHPIDAHFDEVDGRVEQLCDTVLHARLAALETDRLRVQSAIRRGLILSGVPVVLFLFSDAIRAILEAFGGETAAVRFVLDHLTLVFVAITIILIAFVVTRIVVPGTAAQLDYRRRFKSEVVVELFKLVRPQDTYQPNHHVAADVVERSGLFAAPFGSFSGDDLMRGRVGSTEFEASEINAHSRLTVTSGKKSESLHRPNVTRFRGSFFHFALARRLSGHTIIEPEDAQGRLPGHRKGFEKVSVDDEAFAESFRVYSTDPPEARALLTPRLRERLLKLGDHLSQTPFLAFVGDRAFFATHGGRALLEPTIARPASYGTLSTMAEHFALPEALVNHVGVATAASAHAASAGTSILAKPATAGPTFLRSDRPVEAGDLLALGMEPASESDAARRPPPESRVRLSPLTTDGLTVTYGMTPFFFVRLLWTLALTPFVAGGVARLAGEQGRETLDWLTKQIPLVADVADRASEWPWVFAAIALLFYVLPTWGLLHLPRGVRIERGGVRVSRRLWPVARVHPIDRIADVTVSDKQVVLLRKDASLLRRMVFPAPPMGTADKARWLAAHLRRALTCFGGLRS